LLPLKYINYLFIFIYFSILLSQSSIEINKNSFNPPFNQELGRDKDPKVIGDISKFKLFSRKFLWTTLSAPGIRFLNKLIFPKSTISFIDTNDKVVAFSIDDGFCGSDNLSGNMVNEVRNLFSKYNSKATFFVTGTHCHSSMSSDVKLLLDDGHEIANHGMYDWSYAKYSKKDFDADFEKTDLILNNYTENIPKWYRAPHASFSKAMQESLYERGYTHIVCDVFANDTAIPDPQWISEFMLKRIKPGSILLIHMPEKGVREWNYEAMDLTLMGLQKMGYKVVTVSELYNSVK